jgi:hypothetical protein
VQILSGQSSRSKVVAVQVSQSCGGGARRKRTWSPSGSSGVVMVRYTEGQVD